MAAMHLVNRGATHDRKALANENASATAKCRQANPSVARRRERKLHENHLIFMQKTREKREFARAGGVGQMRMAYA
ncbi:hypothetical protein [Kerstersia sp.]|uniref:hypothetical protein n=1 Tax=Kerstersia sp. TaxID=1930783 RepID=UPI003F900B73